MTKLDDAIHAALTEEDKQFLAQFEKEPGSIQQMTGAFGGPMGWIYVAFLLFAVVVAPIGLYSVWQFAISTEMRPLFYWGAAVSAILIVLSVVRIVFFMQINTNRILRELKRLELQVARMASKVDDGTRRG
jgi:hypothetical protein